jgi:vitamin B12 transporter
MSTGLMVRRATAGVSPCVQRCGNILVFSGLLILAAAGGPAQADDQSELQMVVVTATRIPTPQLDVGSSITVVTAADIDARQERTFADVLKDIPGLNVVQTGGPGGETSVFMRGTNSNHTKVFIDGIDVSDPSNATGTFDFGQLLTQDIERVEVLRGPQSGLYGSDAIGGVINIITKSGSGPAQFTGAVEGGSFSTFNQSGTASGSVGGFNYSGSVSHYHAGAAPVTPLDLLQPGEVRNDDYDDNLTLSTKLGYQFTPDFDIGLVGRYTDIQLRTTGEDYEFNPPYAGYPAPQQTTAATDEYATRLTAHLRSFDDTLEQTLGLAFSHDRTDTVVPETPASLNTGDRLKADWQGNIRLATTETLVVGAEYEHDEIDQPIEADVHIGSGYAELQSQIGAHWFSALNVRYDDNSRFGSKATYRFAPAWVIAETDTKLMASIGTGFKAPTLSQLFQNYPPYFFANPNLLPETSTGWDAGVEQGFAQGTLRIGATYFYNRIHDLIDGNADETSWANIGRATTSGVESFISYQPLPQLTLRADYTFTEAYDEVLNQELLRRPKNKGNFIATWQPIEALKLNVDVLTVGTWTDVSRDGSISGLDAPGYTTVNLAASFAINARLSVFGRIDNLLDRHYENPVGFLQPSLGAYAGIKLQL